MKAIEKIKCMVECFNTKFTAELCGLSINSLKKVLTGEKVSIKTNAKAYFIVTCYEDMECFRRQLEWRGYPKSSIEAFSNTLEEYKVRINEV